MTSRHSVPFAVSRDFSDPKRVKQFAYSIAMLLYQVCRHFSPTTHFFHSLAPGQGAYTTRYARLIGVAPADAPELLQRLLHSPMTPEASLR